MTGRIIPVIAALAFLAGIFLIWESDRHSSARHWFDLLPIGEAFPSLQVSDGEGNTVDLDDVLIGKWSLIFFTGAPTQMDTTYPELLVDHFGDTDFQFLAVVPENSVEIERRGSHKAPLLIDVDRAFQNRFGIPAELLSRASWTVLLRPDRTVEFSFPLLLKNQELRRLIEDRLGKPGESFPGEAEAIRVGTRLETLQLERLGSAERIDLDEDFGRPVTLVYFPANTCSVCSISKTDDQMRELAERLTGGEIKHELFVVFSHFVHREDIPDSFEATARRTYQLSKESSVQIENPYVSLGGEETAPFVLEISQDWVVAEKVTLDEWLRSSPTKHSRQMGAALR